MGGKVAPIPETELPVGVEDGLLPGLFVEEAVPPLEEALI